MSRWKTVCYAAILCICCLYPGNVRSENSSSSQDAYWFILHRESNVEYLYYGQPGTRENSILLNIFRVKTGIPTLRPTPLPRLLHRAYWTITDKTESHENPETAPYFLTLDIPAPEEEPYGPSPYLECNGQCNWILPGAFGLHGVGGNPNKLDIQDPGSSGCIRHTDRDITYLYHVLEPSDQEIRYYIEEQTQAMAPPTVNLALVSRQ